MGAARNGTRPEWERKRFAETRSISAEASRDDAASSQYDDAAMESQESTLVPGYRLDRYELICPIATGGMASVWLARLRGKRGFEKLFAIKTIKTELIADPHFQEMFLDEARIASRILHPNVAQILELGEQDDILYIVMEYVDGDSLAKVNRLALKRGSPLPPGTSMRIVAEVCAGLHAAHQLKDSAGESLGVVHRDVSPQNVLITTTGTAKVIDFGLVKARNRAAAETQSGVVKGKIRYMAPEQVGGKAIDHRADVWAAGMCLYELITGHVPYHADDDLEVVKRLMSEDPLPPFDIAMPPQIEQVLARAIVRDPAGRFETCGAMRRAIESAIQELRLPAETDDVADFIKATLPELATKREKTIAKAIEAADARLTVVPALEEGLGPTDIAFAKTEVSARDAIADEPLPLTRRRGAESVKGESDSDGGSAGSSYGARTPSGTTLTEQLHERKRRSSAGLWIAAFTVVGVGAWILYPRVNDDPTVTPVAAHASTALPPSAAPVASTRPSPAESATTSKTLELDSIDTEADAALTSTIDAAAATSASASASAAPTSGPRVVPVTRATSEAPSPPPWDGGLSPGARSAAAIMLAPRPAETTPPPAPTDPPPAP
jgi:serine/threonine-protein kinase